MACSIFVVVLSLFCLFTKRGYHPSQQASSSTINKSLSSDIDEEGLLPIS